MFQPIYKFIELLYKEEEDSSVSLISFFRALGINKTSNKPRINFYISLFNNKVNKLNITSSIESKRFKNDYVSSIINVTDSYIDIYFRKLGSQKSFQLNFNNIKILKQTDIQFISMKLISPIKVTLPKEEKSTVIDEIQIRRIK